MGMPGLSRMESTLACNDTVWDESTAFPKPGLNLSELRATQQSFLLFVSMAFLGCKCDVKGFSLLIGVQLILQTYSQQIINGRENILRLQISD